MRHGIAIPVIALTTCLAAPGLSAQIAWDGPSLVAPSTPLGLSAFLIDPDPSDGVGVLAAWRQDHGALQVGYRALLGDGGADDVAFAAGVDLSGVLARGIEDAPIEVVWWSGVGLGIGSEVLASVPLGLVAGWTGVGDDAVFSPYAGGHVVLDFGSGPFDGVGLVGAVDLGIDLELVSGWMIRFGATLGGRDAFGLGIRVPSGPLRLPD